MSTSITIKTCHSLETIKPQAWNALNQENWPFLRHEFLVALERHHGVGDRYGWLPSFLIAYDTNHELIGAMPLYQKNNSYGELVFDWAWADAYHRHGLAYYPKLVCAIPYTPATGKRILSKPNQISVQKALINAAIDYCQEQAFSGLHCLFPDTNNLQLLLKQGLSQRLDIQYHWHNAHYHDFDDFLATLKHHKRKKIKQERRKVNSFGVHFVTHSGASLDEALWKIIHRFYANTFDEKSGYATLHEGFWLEIANTMGEQIMVTLAYLEDTPIACAIYFHSDQVLYGRHWGCESGLSGKMPGLHFETCYYQGIQYAIDHQFIRFEPGAQGEYKISRGFEPSLTYSAHWLCHDEFRLAIDQYLAQESNAVERYCDTLHDRSAYKIIPPS